MKIYNKIRCVLSSFVFTAFCLVGCSSGNECSNSFVKDYNALPSSVFGSKKDFKDAWAKCEAAFKKHGDQKCLAANLFQGNEPKEVSMRDHKGCAGIKRKLDGFPNSDDCSKEFLDDYNAVGSSVFGNKNDFQGAWAKCEAAFKKYGDQKCLAGNFGKPKEVSIKDLQEHCSKIKDKLDNWR